MKISIINIGDELLIGQVVNTNASQMAKMLTAVGFEVESIYTIGDKAADIDGVLHLCLGRADAVLVTGGLGPTKDDITKKVLCNFFQSELYENEIALATVRRVLQEHGSELTQTNRMQAWIPRCCTMINNEIGTAPGMWFETEDTPAKIVVALPGVPFEMVHLMEKEVIPRLCKHFQSQCIINKNILVSGISEAMLSDLIEPWELSLPKNLKLAYLPQPGMTKLRITARGSNHEDLQKQVLESVEKLYGIADPYIVGEDFESIAELMAEVMHSSKKTLAVAESCTGGAIAAKLTAIPGASSYFKGGIVSYCNEVKENTLGVSHEILEQFGAVSEATAREMAIGAMQKLNSDYAIATTGVAGPSGGTSETPVGTVFIAVASHHECRIFEKHFPGRREQIIERAQNTAYVALIRLVREEILKF